MRPVGTIGQPVLAGGRRPAWTPALISALHLDLDASRGTNTTVDGAAVTSWADQSTNAFPSFTTGTAAPTYKVNALRGLPAIQFTAASSQNLVSTGTISNIGDTANDCIWVVCSVTSVASNGAATYANVGIIDDGNNNYRGIYLKSTGPTVCGYCYDAADNHADATFSLSTPMLVRTRHAGGNVYVRVNNGTETSAAAGNMGNGAQTWQIGRGAGGYLSGLVARVLAMKSPTSTDLARMDSYLRAKYALW